MKFTFCALLSAASAFSNAEMFLQDEINLAVTAPVAHDSIGSGDCQAFFGDDIYDLKGFDQFNRDKKHSMAAKMDANNNSIFIYKACQNNFKMTKGIDLKNSTVWGQDGVNNTITECANEGNAYIVGQAPDLKCKYSFKDSVMTLRETTETDGTVSKIGWNLNWISAEKCGDGNYTVNVEATCDNKATTPTYQLSTSGSSACMTKFDYSGKEGCVDIHMPIAAVLKAVGPFLGVVTIVFGALMTYAGAKFLFIVLSFLVATITASVSFLMIFNLFVPVTASKGTVGGILAACAILGGVVTFLTYKITIKAAVPVIAGICGLFGLLALYRLTGLHIPIVRILFCVGGFALGAFFGAKTQGHVKTIGTAFIGSNIVIQGVSMYAGNIDIPNNADVKKVPTAFWAYLAGWVVLFVSGSVVQKKLFAAEDEKEDAFADEDEGKRCGCF